jgi:hypothetical protein
MTEFPIHPDAVHYVNSPLPGCEAAAVSPAEVAATLSGGHVDMPAARFTLTDLADKLETICAGLPAAVADGSPTRAQVAELAAMLRRAQYSAGDRDRAARLIFIGMSLVASLDGER